MRQKRLDAYNAFVEQIKGAVQIFPEKVAAGIQATTQPSGPNCDQCARASDQTRMTNELSSAMAGIR
jgi:hypothetical protein